MRHEFSSSPRIAVSDEEEAQVPLLFVITNMHLLDQNSVSQKMNLSPF
jgi:hypothetical protein